MTKTEVLQAEGKRSYSIKVTTDKSLTGPFYIPVVDVRDGEKEREIANGILKAARQSKYLRPSFAVGGGSFQVSRKKKD